MVHQVDREDGPPGPDETARQQEFRAHVLRCGEVHLRVETQVNQYREGTRQATRQHEERAQHPSLEA